MNPKQLNILLADDDTDDCEFFKEALAELGSSINISAVHDGEQLMNYLSQGTSITPDVLFLDLNMPRKNGFECLAEIRQNDKWKDLPVIIFSTSFEQQVVDQLYQSGAKYFIRKPPGFSQFKKIILHTLTMMARGSVSQPTREHFVITVEDHEADLKKIAS